MKSYLNVYYVGCTTSSTREGLAPLRRVNTHIVIPMSVFFTSSNSYFLNQTLNIAS